MSIHDERVFIDWVISTLTAADLDVGDGEAPANPSTLDGYVVVHAIAGGITSGSLEAPRSDAAPNVQVSSFGRSARQARWLVAKVRTTLDAAVPASLADGRRVIWLDFPMASVTVIRDDDSDPPMFHAPDRFEMGTA